MTPEPGPILFLQHQLRGLDQDLHHLSNYTALKPSIPCVSKNLCSCGVAIMAEVKATESITSLTAAKNQWSSLAYLHIMERISIIREKSYVEDEDICEYEYGICSLGIYVWKINLKWTANMGKKSEVLKYYFSFPVGSFRIEDEESLKAFIEVHTRLLNWCTNAYLSSNGYHGGASQYF